jgi:hypothetical protein
MLCKAFRIVLLALPLAEWSSMRNWGGTDTDRAHWIRQRWRSWHVDSHPLGAASYHGELLSRAQRRNGSQEYELESYLYAQNNERRLRRLSGSGSVR